jgi:hypothetical protein
VPAARRPPQWDKLFKRFDPELEALEEGWSELGSQLDRDVVDASLDLLGVLLQRAKIPLSFDASRSQDAAELEAEYADDDEVHKSELMAIYQMACRLYPTALGIHYGGEPEDFEEFRVEFIPALLEETEVALGGVTRTASELRARWKRALEGPIYVDVPEDEE